MKVLLSGYYGFGNLGDEALLSGILRVLEQQGHGATVLSNDPAATIQMHGVAATSRLLGAPLAIARTDRFISGGGGLLQDKTSGRSLCYYLALISLAKRFGKRPVVFGQSVGPLSEAGREAVAQVLHGLPIAVRDQASQSLLASLEIEAELVADGALLLPAPPCQKKGDTVLLIPRAGYPDITAALIHTAKALRARNIPVATVLIQPDEDTAPLEQLRQAVPGLELWQAATPEGLLERIGRASYVVSGRLHGLILAARAGVDFCGLVYDPKVRAFLREVGAPAFELPIDREALSTCALIRPAVPEVRLDAMQSRAEAGAGWLKRQLSSP